MSLVDCRVLAVVFCLIFFLCKQKTAYVMLISDWSSDVCSSHLLGLVDEIGGLKQAELAAANLAGLKPDEYRVEEMSPKRDFAMQLLSRFSSQTRDRKSVV